MGQRRSTDPRDSDYRGERRGFGPLNGHTRWVVGVVSALLVAALSAMVWADWSEMRSTSRQNALSIAVIQSNLLQIQATLEEIKHEVKK